MIERGFMGFDRIVRVFHRLVRVFLFGVDIEELTPISEHPFPSNMYLHPPLMDNHYYLTTLKPLIALELAIYNSILYVSIVNKIN